ncbi:MAG: 16S rRNA (adenine(1518)-N(6)/adenine(1519)-N(6))-dimethyltransferase RsmA [Patescibacteria group bacterium]
MDDLASPRVLRETLQRYGLSPRKGLGQNFLIDPNLRDKIVRAAAPVRGELVVEIGPGPGVLTAQLAASGAAVLAVEADVGLARVLRDRLAPAGGRVIVLAADVLGVDLAAQAAAAGLDGHPSLAVGNLPYYITTPVIFHLLETRLPWRRMVFVLQREVAARIAAAPGSKDYGLLSVMTQCRARVETLATMPPGVFWPPPKVHSTLIRLTFPGPYELAGAEASILGGLARAAFGQRRKTLGNACRAWLASLGGDGCFAEACAAVGADPAGRGEELSVAQFVTLARELSRRLGIWGKDGERA